MMKNVRDHSFVCIS